MERRYYTQGDPEGDVRPEDRASAFRFGKDLVPVYGADEDATKFGVPEKAFQLVGFVPRQTVPRHYFVGTSDCVVGAGEHANQALQALCLALEEEDLVGIARFAPKKNSQPRLVVLTPCCRCFYLNNLPFSDEVKPLLWPPPRSEGPSEAQLEAAHALVDALDMKSAAEAAGAKEPLRPKDVKDPAKLRTHQCVIAKALTQRSDLPSTDWHILKPLKPDADLFAAAREQLGAFSAACAVRPPQRAPTRFDPCAPLSVAKTCCHARHNPCGTPCCAATASKTKHTFGDASADGTKRQKVEDAGSGGGSLERAAIPSLAAAVTSVDSGRPVDTFWMMLRDETQDRTDLAVQQMSIVICTLLKQAVEPDDTTGTLGFRCLRELRRACVQVWWR